jgi:hypothetical protein
MSTNTVNLNSQQNVIQERRQNCLNLQGKPQLSLYERTKLDYDCCYIDTQTKQSIGPGKYMVSNHYSCDCNIPDIVETATNLPCVYYKNGYSAAGCAIDGDSMLRVGKTRKYPKCPNQLFTRPYNTVPYMGRGPGNPYLETQLLPGEGTSLKRACNTLSEITVNNMFTPLVDHLQENVQNPEHIIPEDALSGWTRGGNPSRLLVRDVSYLEKCGYKYMDRKNASGFWKDKHIYL